MPKPSSIVPLVGASSTVEKISKYQLQTPPYPDLIRVMQRHPSRPSIRRVFRAGIEKILRDPTHPSMRRSRRV